MNKSLAPLIIAIVVLLLPVLYAGSYFAMVIPFRLDEATMKGSRAGKAYSYGYCYRFGDEYAAMLFWPLEQIDQRTRPAQWWHDAQLIEVGYP
ncbi:hypothetical protein [Anatilimnocola floriformis]|uniref:hypothetical protein n=1 Tax=Anatilimnocola floriformis TaxID=2948575 RepID=UPI0020C566FD|nr:hypothetical protein [Anatilimnocola floriformis]